MDNKIFTRFRMRARLSFRALTLPAEATRRSINSASLRATDHLFATRVITVNESSKGKSKRKSERGDAHCFFQEMANANEPGAPSININVLINIMRRLYCLAFIVVLGNSRARLAL